MSTTSMSTSPQLCFNSASNWPSWNRWWLKVGELWRSIFKIIRSQIIRWIGHVQRLPRQQKRLRYERDQSMKSNEKGREENEWMHWTRTWRTDAGNKKFDNFNNEWKKMEGNRQPSSWPKRHVVLIYFNKVSILQTVIWLKPVSTDIYLIGSWGFISMVGRKRLSVSHISNVLHLHSLFTLY